MTIEHYKDLINNFFYNKKQLFGPFVYRLGHVVFILERGVRFPQGPPLFTIMTYFVYMIRSISSKKRKTYVGYTKDLKKRINLHNMNKGAKSTKGFKWKIIYKKKISNKKEAMSYEYKLKHDRKKRDIIYNKSL